MAAQADDLTTRRILRASAAPRGSLRWFADVARVTAGVATVNVVAPNVFDLEVTVALGLRAWLPWVNRRVRRAVHEALAIGAPPGVVLKVRVVRALRPARSVL